MIDIIEENKDLLDLLIQLLIIVLPIVLTWFARTYVKSEQAQKRMGSIVRLANIAIDYAEDLDKRGDLDKYLRMYNLPQEIIDHTSRGIQKLNLAGVFVEQELAKIGVEVTNEEAKAWIASEFRSRVGDIGKERTAVTRAQEAVVILQNLDQSGLIDLPDDVDQALHIADRIADWILEQTDGEDDPVVQHEVRLRVRRELLGNGTPTGNTPPPSPKAPSGTDLETLAQEAVRYVEELKQSHDLTLPESDVAAAWILTEVTKRNIPVTTDQIARAVREAMAEANQA
jgi:hypothetical protein